MASRAESYGHDIEASWLLLESAYVVGDAALTAKTLEHTSHIADAGLQGWFLEISLSQLPHVHRSHTLTRRNG